MQRVYAVVFLTLSTSRSNRTGPSIAKRRTWSLASIWMALGMWIGENESSKFWLSVLGDLKNRGVQGILITCVDNLNGFSETITASYPKTEIQKCIIHQIRNSTRYVSYKDLKKVTADLKPNYKASTEEAAL
ncbi:transposase [Paenibacillus larvae]|nr:transposase [Paenibacillus larvae]MDT2192983.1 transposase [Paenibacillus larvae]